MHIHMSGRVHAYMLLAQLMICVLPYQGYCCSRVDKKCDRLSLDLSFNLPVRPFLLLHWAPQAEGCSFSCCLVHSRAKWPFFQQVGAVALVFALLFSTSRLGFHCSGWRPTQPRFCPSDRGVPSSVPVCCPTSAPKQ